jgi:fumarylacetoacetase
VNWLDLPPDTPFGVANLPYGVFSHSLGGRHVGVAIGDHVLDLTSTAARLDLPDAGLVAGAGAQPAARRRTGRMAGLRDRITTWLSERAPPTPSVHT